MYYTAQTGLSPAINAIATTGATRLLADLMLLRHGFVRWATHRTN